MVVVRYIWSFFSRQSCVYSNQLFTLSKNKLSSWLFFAPSYIIYSRASLDHSEIQKCSLSF